MPYEPQVLRTYIWQGELKEDETALEVIDIDTFISEPENILTKHGISIKPYLRPMSSMTNEEKTYYFAINENPVTCIDWLNSHHFDYRGLIEKNLAINAPDDMYSIKQ